MFGRKKKVNDKMDENRKDKNKVIN